MIVNFASKLGGANLLCRAHVLRDTAGTVTVDWLKAEFGLFGGAIEVGELGEWDESQKSYASVYDRLCAEALSYARSVVETATAPVKETVAP